MNEKIEYEINSATYEWTSRLFTLLRKVLAVNLKLHQQDAQIADGDIFLFNHFARFETFIPQYLIHMESGAYCRSIAAGEFFVEGDAFSNYLIRVGAVPGIVLGQRRQILVPHSVDGRVVLQLVASTHRVGERAQHPVLDLLGEGGVRCRRVDRQLGFAGGSYQFVDLVDKPSDRLVTRLERAKHLVLGDLLGARLDHDQRVFAAGHHEVQLTPSSLVVGRVDQQRPVEEPDPHRRDRAGERDLREGQCRGGAGQRQHVRIVFRVGRDHERHHLRFVAPAPREQRTDRAVDPPARQHFLFGGFAFPLEEAARDPARGVGVLPVVDGQGEKVDPVPFVR